MVKMKQFYTNGYDYSKHVKGSVKKRQFILTVCMENIRRLDFKSGDAFITYIP